VPDRKNALLQSGYRDEGVLGYVFVAPASGFVPLYGYSHPSEKRFLTVDRQWEETALLQQGYIYDGIEGYVFPRPGYKVGAYYFGMFSPKAFEPDDLIFRNRSFYYDYGWDRAHDYWMGVRDLHEHLLIQAPNLNPVFWDWWNLWDTGEWSHLKPRIGYYDQAQVSTLEKRIQQASENGIHYFNFYWYWHHYLNKESINDGLERFLKAANSAKMQFMLSICAHGYYWTISREQIPAVAEWIVSNYVTHSNYLKTSTGQPIITICDPRGIWCKGTLDSPQPPTPTAWDSVNLLLNELRARTHARLGVYPVILGRSDEDSYPTLINYVEGGACVLSFTPRMNYQFSAENIGVRLDELRRSKPMMPCVSQNFDNRPRMGIMIDDPATMGTFSDYKPTRDFEPLFRTALERKKRWMDTQTDELSQYLTIYAWNEWHEGGIIEPNERDGAFHLKTINEVFGLVKGSHPCRETGDCPGQ
jgi:hypothetical protein